MITRIVVGMLETNCYVVNNTDRKAVVIDPGDNDEKISLFVESNNLDVLAIVNTHGHYDHIKASGILQQKWDVPVFIRSEDAYMFDYDWAGYLGMPFAMIKPDRIEFLNNRDEIREDSMTFRIIHTPGHSPGGVSLYYSNENTLFSGDTLFYAGIGRTDLMMGNSNAMQQSLKTLFELFPDDTRVCPGHGPETTIGDEKWNRTNSFF